MRSDDRPLSFRTGRGAVGSLASALVPALVLAVGLALVLPWPAGAGAADLVDPGPPAVFVRRPPPVEAPPVRLIVDVLPPDFVSAVCPPGYAHDAGGRCLRTDLPSVACDPAVCAVVPPDPIPYGIGPALRRGY